MITAEQLELRRKYIGSSDTAAILGMSPWANAEDVRLIKSGLAEDKPDTEWMKLGTYLEPGIRAYAADVLEMPLDTPDTYIHPNGIMCANLDAETPYGEPVEIKASGIAGPIFGNWGSPGTAEIPEYYYIQIQHQIACSKKNPKRGWCAGLLGGRGLCMYEIPRNDEVISLIEKHDCNFWQVHIIGGHPAAKIMANLEVLKRVRRQPGLVVPIDKTPWQEFMAYRDAAKKADAALEESKRRVLSLITSVKTPGDAVEVDGQIVATYRANKAGVRSLKVKDES